MLKFIEKDFARAFTPSHLHDSVLCTRQCVCVSFSSLEVNNSVRLNIECTREEHEKKKKVPKIISKKRCK